LITEDGEQLGIVDLEEALKQAREKELDLVEVAPQANPPVCRVMDYNKYKYEQEKKEKKSRKGQKIIHLKQIRVRPNIEEHDYQVKLKNLRKFLEKGDKVKIFLMFKGRERAHPEIGNKILNKFIGDLSDISEIEQPPILKGRFMTTVLNTKS